MPASERDAVSGFRDVCFPAQAVVQRLLQQLHLFEFALNKIQLRLGCELACRFDELRLSCVCRESTQGMSLGIHRDALMQQLRRFRAIDDNASEGATCLSKAMRGISTLDIQPSVHILARARLDAYQR